MGPTVTSDRTAPTYVRYLVLAWLCSAAALAYIHRNCISVPVEQIQADLSLDTKQMGWVLSGFFLTYAIFQLPSAWLCDRWGTRLLLPIIVALWSVAVAWTGLATGFWLLLAAWAANGVAQAGVFPCSVNTCAKWFPTSQRAFPSGMLGSFMQWGGVIAASLTAFLLNYWSWRTAFIILAVPGLAWSVGFYLWFRDRPSQHAWVNDGERTLIEGSEGPSNEGAAREPTPWRLILTSPVMGLICLQQFFRASGYVFYQSWFPTYLRKTQGVSAEESGYLTSLALSGFAVGAMIGGALSDAIVSRTGSRRLGRQGVAIGFLLISASCILGAFAVADATQANVLITMGSFCSGVAAPVGYTITMDLGGRHVSTVFSLMNMSGNLGGSLCPIAVAWLVIQTGERWELVLLLFSGIYLASAVCWMFLDPNRPVAEPAPVRAVE